MELVIVNCIIRLGGVVEIFKIYDSTFPSQSSRFEILPSRPSNQRITKRIEAHQMKKETESNVSEILNKIG